MEFEIETSNINIANRLKVTSYLCLLFFCRITK